MKLTKLEVIEILKRFIRNESTDYEWDDFVSVPIANDELDEVRLKCLNLPERFPSENKGQYCSDEGLRCLEEILKNLENHS